MVEFVALSNLLPISKKRKEKENGRKKERKNERKKERSIKRKANSIGWALQISIFMT